MNLIHFRIVASGERSGGDPPTRLTEPAVDEQSRRFDRWGTSLATKGECDFADLAQLRHQTKDLRKAVIDVAWSLARPRVWMWASRSIRNKPVAAGCSPV